MSDPYASIDQADTQVQERLANVLELRAADAQQRAMLDCYLADFNLQNEARVLEIGCGTGAIARVLAGRPGIASVVDIDLGEVFLERARKLSSGIFNLSFERGDGRSLRYADGYFDAVIMHTLLSHVPSPERSLAEAFRVLRPGGLVKPNAERCAGGYMRDKESLWMYVCVGEQRGLGCLHASEIHWGPVKSVHEDSDWRLRVCSTFCDLLIEQCQGALKETDASGAVREILERTVSKPTEVLAGLGEPARATVQKLHVADDLTIINVIWGPHMTIMPHNHKMTAIIGVYTGAEDNIFWRRTGDPLGLIKAAGARSLRAKDVEAIGPDAIHSVTNPILRLTGAIHVYLGPFFTVHRSEWNPETLIEGSYDIEKNMRLFEESNARLAIN